MGKGKANKTAPKPVDAVGASAAAMAKREGNTLMATSFRPAAVQKTETKTTALTMKLKRCCYHGTMSCLPGTDRSIMLMVLRTGFIVHYFAPRYGTLLHRDTVHFCTAVQYTFNSNAKGTYPTALWSL